MTGFTELVWTVAALVTVAAVPAAIGLATGMRRGNGLVLASIVAAVIAVFWSVFWSTVSHPPHHKHTILFAVLAVVALLGASFSRPTRTV